MAYLERKNNYKVAAMNIYLHNKEPGVTYTLAHNRMSDWHSNERNSLNGFIPHEEGAPDLADEEHTDTSHKEVFDWRQHIDLSIVKDVFTHNIKKVCKADWAISCVSAFEASL